MNTPPAAPAPGPDLPVLLTYRGPGTAADPLAEWRALAGVIAWTENHAPWLPGHERCGYIRFGRNVIACSCGELRYRVIDLAGAAA